MKQRNSAQLALAMAAWVATPVARAENKEAGFRGLDLLVVAERFVHQIPA